MLLFKSGHGDFTSPLFTDFLDLIKLIITNSYFCQKTNKQRKNPQKYFKFLAGLSALDFLDWWGFLALMICFCENVF